MVDDNNAKKTYFTGRIYSLMYVWKIFDILEFAHVEKLNVMCTFVFRSFFLFIKSPND